jgi:hypothetical protein
MSKAEHLHTQAMELADEGDHLRRQAKRKFGEAFDLELEAAEVVGSNPVLYRSAAACALEAGMYDEAIRVAKIGLTKPCDQYVKEGLQDVIDLATEAQ